MSLTDDVKMEAHRLGFNLVGVAPPDTLSHYSVFEKWLAQNQHGEMSYLASERSRRCRAAPRQILPECESILVLGYRYPAPIETYPTVQGEILSGRVASYAWGVDYHDFLAGRLETLVIFIEDKVGHPVSNRWYTDTGPILERELAQRAGLGWISKNTCLINPHLGSYFFLAEILLDILLVPDQPFSVDHCGSCTRCIDACPTACILPNRTLDARRCISYLTIEYKGVIPPELRLLTNNWLFGCDICQQVCPWNMHATTSKQTLPIETVSNFLLSDFLSQSAQSDISQPDLTREIMLSAQAFRARFQNNPITRAKRSGYLRNVAVALGNSRSINAVPGLMQALNNDPESLVRSHAAWALGQIDDSTARQALQKAMDTEIDPDVYLEIRNALNDVDDQKDMLL